MRVLIFILALTFGCLTARAQQPDPFQLRGPVLKELSFAFGNTPFAMIAELEYGNKRAAVFWPMLLKDDGTYDDDIMAYIFEKGEQGWHKVYRLYEITHQDVENFYIAFGTQNGYKIHRPEGPSKAEIPNFLDSHLSAIADAWQKKDLNRLAAIAEEMAPFFSLDLCAWNDAFTESVVMAMYLERYEFEVDDCQYKGDLGSCRFDLTVKENGVVEYSHGELELALDRGWRITFGSETKGRR